jgi:hypothetical protein
MLIRSIINAQILALARLSLVKTCWSRRVGSGQSLGHLKETTCLSCLAAYLSIWFNRRFPFVSQRADLLGIPLTFSPAFFELFCLLSHGLRFWTSDRPSRDHCQ